MNNKKPHNTLTEAPAETHTPPRRPRRRRVFDQSEKMKNVLYEIRGPVAEEAERLELDGHRILKLNTGNPAVFGFEAPDVIVQDMIAASHFRKGIRHLKALLLPAAPW